MEHSMLETKHTYITEDLRKGILNGRFGRKLPPLRTLMKDYNVSMQTITKAVRPLADNGLISPGPRGSAIRVFEGRRPKYWAWGILNRRALERGDVIGLQSHGLINSVLGHGGYNVTYLDARNERMRTDPDFWKTLPVDGLVFQYGTLTTELALTVRRHGIAAVSLHQADDLPVNVVEWDTFGAISETVEQLLNHGYRRIALQFAYPLEGYQNYANRNWDAIRERFGIAYPEYRENVMPGNEDNRERHTGYLCLSTPPEVILCWHIYTDETWRTLRNLGLENKVKLVSFISRYHKDTSYLSLLSEPKDTVFWETVDSVLRMAVENPSAPPIRKLVPFHPVFLEEFPKKKG